MSTMLLAPMSSFFSLDRDIQEGSLERLLYMNMNLTSHCFTSAKSKLRKLQANAGVLVAALKVLAPHLL